MSNVKTALITGASAGLGLEFAKRFAKDGYDVVLVARSHDVLDSLAKSLKEQYGVNTYVIAKDLSRSEAPDEIVNELKRLHVHIDILVNNAGFGLYGPFIETDIATEVKMIQLNVITLTHLTKLLLPAMLEKRSGKILNVASTAAFQPGPLMSVYYATKAYVLSFSEALENELKHSGVTVSILCPGPTETQFQTAAKMESSKLFTRKGMMLDAHTVAEAGYQGLMKNQRIIIPGFLNKVPVFMLRFTPRKLIPGIVRKIQESRS